MTLERSEHRLSKTLKGDVLVLGPLRASAESSVDGHVGVHEEDGEREVEVILEVGQVDRIGLNDPNADELVEKVPDDRCAAGDVVVEFLTCLAWNAAKNDQHRLA